MKAYFPYVYLVRHVPKRRKRAVFGYGADTVEADIPEISASVTKLVASIEYLLRRPSGTVVAPYQFRAWDGDLIAPVKDDDFSDFRVEWLLSIPGGRSAAPYAFRHLYGLVAFEEKAHRIERYLYGNVAGAADFHGFEELGDRIVESRREEDHAIVSKLARDLVSVDGKLWRKVRKVGLYLDMRMFSEKLHLSFHGERYGYLPGTGDSAEERGRYPGWDRSFDHSQMDRAITHAGQRGVEQGFRALEIADPEALSFDGEKDFILNAMDYAVIRNKSHVGEMPLAVASAWTAARSAVERLRADARSDFSDDEIDAFRALAEGSVCEEADLVKRAFTACEEYLNDPWGRYASHPRPLHARDGLPRP